MNHSLTPAQESARAKGVFERYADGSVRQVGWIDATCRFCEDDIHLEVDPTGQRGTAWADESFPVAPGDDRAFQCVFSPEGQHSPERQS